MASNDSGISRRSLVFGAASAGAFVGPAAAQLATDVLLRGTPQLTTGPFYPVLRPLEADADLTKLRGRSGVAKGTIIDVGGRVLTESGRPAQGAKLDLWQANAFGRYDHPADPAKAPLDPAFQGAAVLTTDKDGRFRFRTVLPGPYGKRARHIHFDVTGRRRRLVTQMFFAGERNEDDHLYRAIFSHAQKEAAVGRLAPAPAQKGTPLTCGTSCSSESRMPLRGECPLVESVRSYFPLQRPSGFQSVMLIHGFDAGWRTRSMDRRISVPALDRRIGGPSGTHVDCPAGTTFTPPGVSRHWLPSNMYHASTPECVCGLVVMPGGVRASM